jgi:hypothetical protein
MPEGPYIERIRARIRHGDFRFSKHATKRMGLRGRTLHDVQHTILEGELLREYPERKALP